MGVSQQCPTLPRRVPVTLVWAARAIPMHREGTAFTANKAPYHPWLLIS